MARSSSERALGARCSSPPQRSCTPVSPTSAGQPGYPTCSMGPLLNLTPSLADASALARDYDVVPLYAEFIGDLETPISAVLKFSGEDNVFLLESAEAAERFGRYSFLGFDPKRTLSYRSGLYTIVDADGVREVPARDPFRGLAEILGERSVAPLPNLPRSEEHTSELQSRQYLVCRLL